jgi:YVTN family beta-propeller protein
MSQSPYRAGGKKGLRFAGLIAAAAALLPLVALGVAPSSPTYRITQKVALGAPDRWDYVVFDPVSSRVFVAHGDHVTVVDGVSGSVVGQVEGFPGGTHGTAIVAALGKGFTDDGEAGEAGAFDLKTLKVTTRIRTAEDADGLAFDPASGHVFVINGDTGTVTVIDPKTDSAIATVNGGGKLEAGIASTDGKIYVNGAEKREILRIDTRGNRIDARWPIQACQSPHGIAIDPLARRLFSSCVNKLLVVVNLDTGGTVATVPIGAGTDAAVFDPKRKLVLSSNGRDGTLTVIREKTPDSYEVVATIETAVSARTMDIDPSSGRVYLAAADRDERVAAGHGKAAIVAGSLKLLFLDPAP